MRILLIQRTPIATVLALVAILSACSGGGSDDDPIQFDAGDLAGTWLMSADYSWRVDDPALAGDGSETMRAVVTIRSDDPQHATVHNCYPGVGVQQITVENNQFEYLLFDAPVVFKLVAEGVEAPRIDLRTGNILLPGPASMAVPRADADIDADSGEVALKGIARLVRISDEIVSVTDATVTFEGEAPVDLALQCFTEIDRRSRLLGALSEDHIHSVLADGVQQDTLIEIDVSLSSESDDSAAEMGFSGLQRTLVMQNADPLAGDLFVTDEADLSFELPMEGQGEFATVKVQFQPVDE